MAGLDIGSMPGNWPGNSKTFDARKLSPPNEKPVSGRVAFWSIACITWDAYARGEEGEVNSIRSSPDHVVRNGIEVWGWVV